VRIIDVGHHDAMRRRGDNGMYEPLVRAPRIDWNYGLRRGPDSWLSLADSAISSQILHSKTYIAAQGDLRGQSDENRGPQHFWAVSSGFF
jgi:hypothetical protein